MEVQPYVVLKRFSGNGQQYRYGQVVDASSWRNKQRLIANKYIGLLEYGTEPVKDTKGNYWITEEDGRKAGAKFPKTEKAKA